jgi:hypothetical protein
MHCQEYLLPVFVAVDGRQSASISIDDLIIIISAAVLNSHSTTTSISIDGCSSIVISNSKSFTV